MIRWWTTMAPPPTSRPIQEMASHIEFEHRRTHVSFKLHLRQYAGDLRDLLGETFLLHSRNLLEFFYGDEKRGGDARAIHYLDAQSTWKPNKPVWFEDHCIRCNKLLVHLTYERVSYKADGKMRWSFGDKVAHLEQEWQAFISALPPERRAWFKN